MSPGMRRTFVVLLSASVAAVSCDKDSAAPIPPPASNEATAQPEADGDAPEDQAATAPDDAKAKQDKQLAEMMVKIEERAKKRSARWTPELEAKVAPLLEKDWKNTKKAMQKIVASEHREPGNAERDKHRHPVQMATFFGLEPDMKVFELGQGAGWWTELLAPLLAKKGKLYIAGADPESQDAEQKARRRAAELFVSASGNLYSKLEIVPQPGGELTLGEPGSLDMVLVFRMFHNFHRANLWDKVMPAIHAGLKDGGVLAVEQHRADEGANPDETAKQGYLPQKWLVEKIESYGFVLDKASEMNANPKDTKDHPEGVWTLPPTLALGEKDKEKYQAIGESDRMTLKFVKKTAKKKK
jgi:predicted methyltransferase